MVKCNVEGCHEEIMVGLQSKVSKKSIWVTIAGSLGIIAILVVMWADTRGLPEDRKKAEAREERITRLEEQVSAIKTRQNDIYTNTQRILNKLGTL